MTNVEDKCLESVAEEPSKSHGLRAEDDPLLALVGSGKEIWADEHADEYVARLRREWL